ncbi:hypothetical protein VitviT2T_002399 [Vitis vinifera]|uniref:Uncharacterized protein n=1 Tax=Vitis vinifera TaxID=29760 RepID=A0ABY9BIC7_VITVI|nr:hypothetical protein VitviT2T_002399 [Vitis vinifera]
MREASHLRDSLNGTTIKSSRIVNAPSVPHPEVAHDQILLDHRLLLHSIDFPIARASASVWYIISIMSTPISPLKGALHADYYQKKISVRNTSALVISADYASDDHQQQD